MAFVFDVYKKLPDFAHWSFFVVPNKKRQIDFNLGLAKNWIDFKCSFCMLNFVQTDKKVIGFNLLTFEAFPGEHLLFLFN